MQNKTFNHKQTTATVSGNNFGLMSGSREKKTGNLHRIQRAVFYLQCKSVFNSRKKNVKFGDDFKINECASNDTRLTGMN